MSPTDTAHGHHANPITLQSRKRTNNTSPKLPLEENKLRSNYQNSKVISVININSTIEFRLICINQELNYQAILMTFSTNIGNFLRTDKRYFLIVVF